MPFRDLPSVIAEVETLAHAFQAAGHRLYLVGGIVRDLWLDRDVSERVDLDLTTDALPEEIKSIVSPLADALWLQGERFGTVGAQIEGRPYEITTHRHEVYDAESRKPSVAFSTAIDEDLSRRDFTVNAMAVEVPSQGLVDPFGGARDLASRTLRTPLDPEVSFTDDPLRMLRAARFTAGYGLEPDDALIAAMRSLRERLDIVSTERIRDEFDKLLEVSAPAPGMTLLAETGLLERFLPEASSATVSPRLAAMLAALPPDARLRLAALLFDVPRSEAARRLRTMRHSNERRRTTLALLDAARELAAGEIHDAPSLRRWLARFGEHRDDARRLAAAVAGADAQVERSAALELSLADEVHDLGPALSGEEVKAILGVSEGPAVGDAISFLQELRFDEGPLAAQEARERLLDWWGSRS